MPTRRALLSSATVAPGLSLAAPAIAQPDGQIPVVATFSILGDMVKRIGERHVAVTTLVDPDGDARAAPPSSCRSVALAFRLAGSIMSANTGAPFEVLP